MTPRSAAAVLALLAAAVALSYAGSLAHRRPAPRAIRPGPVGGTAGTRPYEEARERARPYPFYRSLFTRRAVTSAAPLPDGGVGLTVDLRALARGAFARTGFEGLEDALPAAATVEMRPLGAGVREDWRLPCPDRCLLDVFAAQGVDAGFRAGAVAFGGAPDAVAVFRLAPERFRDLAVGARAQRVLRDRAVLVEAILGRPVRAPAAEDLSGAGAAAFYRDPEGGPARAIVALQLVRSDRVRALLDLVLGLGALTRGATVRRHREVAIGALASGGPGLAAAVDGTLLLVASDPARIEDAIDRLRDPSRGTAPAGLPPLGEASFRLRGADGLEAALTRERDGWRLEAQGPRALADDAVVAAWLRGKGGAGSRGAAY